MARYILSTVGRKQLIGFSGLGLSIFVLFHMCLNLFIFLGPETYNRMAHSLTSNPLILIFEAGLALLFVAHLAMALRVTWNNYRARSQKYFRSASGSKKTTFSSKTMWHQGVVLLVFIVWHLITFKFGAEYEVQYENLVIRDLFQVVLEAFQQPLYVAGYVFALLVLMLHLSHGLSSSLKTLGLSHRNYVKLVNKLGLIYSIVVGLGFISQPIYIFFFYKP